MGRNPTPECRETTSHRELNWPAGYASAIMGRYGADRFLRSPVPSMQTPGGIGDILIRPQVYLKTRTIK